MFGLLGFGSFPLGRIGQDKRGCPPGRDVSRTDEGPPGAETSGPACTLYRPSPSIFAAPSVRRGNGLPVSLGRSRPLRSDGCALGESPHESARGNSRG